jgi:uncharacterized protein YciI
MRFWIGVGLCLAISASAGTNQAGPSTVRDVELAQRLGADERGMRKYVLVLLRTGLYVAKSEDERARLFEGHFANINRLAEQGKLLVAGPMEQNDQQYRGVFILSVSTISEAQAMVADDPTVASGIFLPAYFEWYASAALVETANIHRRIAP